MVPKFSTKYDNRDFPSEVNSGEKITDPIGYMPIDKMIKNMLLAGQRLQAIRREQFDFEGDDDLDEDFYDPTRHSGFDMADASMLSISIANRQKYNEVEPLTEPEAEPAADLDNTPEKAGE